MVGQNRVKDPESNPAEGCQIDVQLPWFDEVWTRSNLTVVAFMNLTDRLMEEFDMMCMRLAYAMPCPPKWEPD